MGLEGLKRVRVPGQHKPVTVTFQVKVSARPNAGHGRGASVGSCALDCGSSTLKLAKSLSLDKK
jgi:hypothetical protein